MERTLNLDTKYRIFRTLPGNGNNPHVNTIVLENCTHEVFDSEADAKAWILEHADYRSLEYSYMVLSCIIVKATYE